MYTRICVSVCTVSFPLRVWCRRWSHCVGVGRVVASHCEWPTARNKRGQSGTPPHPQQHTLAKRRMQHEGGGAYVCRHVCVWAVCLADQFSDQGKDTKTNLCQQHTHTHRNQAHTHTMSGTRHKEKPGTLYFRGERNDARVSHVLLCCVCVC